MTTSPDPTLSRVSLGICLVLRLRHNTDLILSTESVIRESEECFETLVREMMEAPRMNPGSVSVRGKRPLRFLAVVHDTK